MARCLIQTAGIRAIFGLLYKRSEAEYVKNPRLGGNVSDKPENLSGSRRRGPLGEESEASETRRGGPRRISDDDATQQISTDDSTQRIPVDESTRRISSEERDASRKRGGSEGSRSQGGSGWRDRSSDTQEFESPVKTAAGGQAERQEGGGRTRAARSTGGKAGAGAAASAGSGAGGGYSTGYSNVLQDREEYLRDIYGGVDWLASFVGFVFTLLLSGLLGLGATLFLLMPLDLQSSLEGGQLTSTSITGFSVIAAVGFFAFLFGGYVSGRMGRYDGGRNGAMVLLWTVLITALLLVLSGVLGQTISGTPMGSFVGDVLGFGDAAVDLLAGLGIPGAVVSGVIALVALVGGMVGGRLGSRYHREIDYTP
jgi:hypothetical protein